MTTKILHLYNPALKPNYMKILSLAFTVIFVFLALQLNLLATPKHSPTLLIAKKVNMKENDPIVTIETNKGNITLEIFKDKAPKTSENFLDLVNKGFYNGLTFHRYEPGFCIQGGDPSGNGTGSYVDPVTKQTRHIDLEVRPDLKHDSAGVLAMARSSDPNSASCQFYITLGPASFLDMQYAVFGKVVNGLNVVMQLRKGDVMNKVYVNEAKVKH